MVEIAVVGTGMYAIGRQTDGFGTILPAIHEWSTRQESSVVVHLIGSTGSSNDSVREKIDLFKEKSQSKLDLRIWLSDKVNDPLAYDKALSALTDLMCVIVAVPDHLHYEVAKCAIQKRIPVLVVKPLTPTAVEHLDLISLCMKYEVYGAVEFHKRFDEANLVLRDVVRSGDIGVLNHIVVEYSQRIIVPTNIFTSWVERTNIFQYLGVHYVDIVFFITGAYPTRVMAIGQKNKLVRCGVDTYDSIQCKVEWRGVDDGTFVQDILVGWVDPNTSPAMSNQRIKFIGSEGRIESDQTNRGIVFYGTNQPLQTPNPYFCTSYNSESGFLRWSGYGIRNIKTFLDDCCDLRGGLVEPQDLDSLRPSFKSSYVSTMVIDACNRSLAQSGIWIEIETNRFLGA